MSPDAARCFDALAADSRWRGFTAQERRIVDEFKRQWGIKPGQRVLEPGCGSGRLTEILAELVGPAGCVVAFDASAEFIRVAAKRALPGQVHLNVCRFEAFELPSAEFDHIVCFNVFPHLVPHSVTARRLAAALRPSGILWVAHTCSRKFVNEIHRSGPASIRRHLLPPPARFKRLLQAAGLCDVVIFDGPEHFLSKAVRPARAGPGAD